MPKTIIAANWKMNFNINDARKFILGIREFVEDDKCEVIICAPYVYLQAVKECAKGTSIKIGAQNMYYEDKGAYTGEISPLMLKDLEVEYLIVGHSERRAFFNESDTIINKKLKTALKYNIKPILCIGESLEDREISNTNSFLEQQLRKDLKNVSSKEVQNIVIAYEPIWAIGTGKTATSAMANETIGFVRNVIEKMYGKEVSENISIVYGGSVKADTIKEQMEKEHINGALVGGASLIMDEFLNIVNY